MNNEKLGLNTFEKVLIMIIPVIVAAIFYNLPSLTYLIEMIPFIPNIQLINFILELENDWINWVLACIGLILGIFVSMYIFTEILKVEVNRDYVVVDIFDEKTDIQKADVESVFKEEKQLVLISSDGYEIIRENTDHSAEKLKNAFQRFNYPWVDEDPYYDEFFEWTVDHEDLSERANNILYDRRQAGRDGEEKKMKNFRQDLMELGIIVKDVHNSQFIRLVNR